MKLALTFLGNEEDEFQLTRGDLACLLLIFTFEKRIEYFVGKELLGNCHGWERVTEFTHSFQERESNLTVTSQIRESLQCTSISPNIEAICNKPPTPRIHSQL